MSEPLFERCAVCRAAQQANPGIACPACRGERYVAVGLTSGQVERLADQRDALLVACVAAIPFVRAAIEAAVDVPGFDPESHVVLAALRAASKGLRPLRPPHLLPGEAPHRPASAGEEVPSA